MTHRPLIFSCLAVCLITTGTIATIADEPASKTLILFDGKTLEGWKKSDFFKAAETEIKVGDGSILMPVGSPMTGVTTTRTDLPDSNYELTYEAKRIGGGDFFAAATFPVGKSFITFVNGGWGGSVTGLSNINGANASENETTKFVKYQDGTWYRFRVRVTAKVIRGSVDDKEVFAINHEDSKLGTRVESRSSQPLGFSTYKSGGMLRKVEIRPLTAAEIATADKLD